MTNSKSIQDLQNDIRELARAATPNNYKETDEKIKQIDEQITDLKISKLLDETNGKQNRLREIAKQAWEAEQPTEDITTSDGSFHKVKIKKYPVLASLKYASASYEDGKMYILRINGEKFQMYHKKYNGSDPVTYTRPTSFDDFLELNCISLEDMTKDKFLAIREEMNAANEELKKHIKEYGDKMEKLNAWGLSNWGLVSQRSEYLYLKYPN